MVRFSRFLGDVGGTDARALGHLDGGVNARVFPLFLGRSCVSGAKRPSRPFRRFRVSVGEVLRFKDVEIFAFSGMLHFQMFECFCFGLDDFAKFGKLKILRALINLLAYLQKLQ